MGQIIRQRNTGGPLGKTDRITQLLKKKTEWKWAEKEQDIEEMKKMITEIQCFIQFAGDRGNIVTAETSRTGHGKTLPKTKYNMI